MGIRGPIRKSAEQRQQEGSPAHRPLPPARSQQGFGLPEPPRGMGAAAKRVWQSYVEQMAPLGTLRRVDGFALRRLCQDVAELQRLQSDKRKLVREMKKAAQNAGRPLSGSALMELETSSEGRRLQATINALSSRIARQEDRFGLNPISGTRLDASGTMPSGLGVAGSFDSEGSIEASIQ